MNLSRYLQMPPAPSVSKSLTSSPTQGPAAGASATTGNGLGLDFAQLMAKQFQHMSATQRQDLAAATRQNEAADNAQTHSEQAQQDDRASAQSQDSAQQTTDRKSQSDAASQTRRRDAQDGTRDERSDPAAASPARPRARTATAASHDDTLPSWMAQHSTLRPDAQPADATQTASQSASAATNTLHTIELSPQVRIITDPGQAPSPESLTAFAKAMGLDEAAIQKLMGQPSAQDPATTVTTVDANGLATTAPTTAPTGASAPNALLAALHAHADGRSQFAFQTTQPMGPAAVTASLTGEALATSMAPAMTNVEATAALNTQIGTSMNAPLQPMTAAEMASIQQIQITVLPAAVLPAGTHASGAGATPSTLDVLSLMGGTAHEEDISALVSAFSQGEAGESGSQQQGQSNDNGSNSGFAQAMTRHNATNAAGPNASTQATASTPMSEVYDQLSDKMATEMAARMHKQLSDGEWKMKFGLRPANLGGVEIQLEMKDGKLDAVFRADNPLTRDLLQNSSQRLRDALENFGIQAGQVHIGNNASQNQQNPSNGSSKQPQVGDNSPLQVNASNDTTPVAARNKANASLLDLYA